MSLYGAVNSLSALLVYVGKTTVLLRRNLEANGFARSRTPFHIREHINYAVCCYLCIMKYGVDYPHQSTLISKYCPQFSLNACHKAKQSVFKHRSSFLHKNTLK